MDMSLVTCVYCKLAGKLSICFFCMLPIKFLMVSWGRLSNLCDMWNCNLFKFSTHFSCVIETNNSLLTANEAIYWCNIIYKIWYIFMYRVLFGDVLKIYIFIFWLSVLQTWHLWKIQEKRESTRSGIAWKNRDMKDSIFSQSNFSDRSVSVNISHTGIEMFHRLSDHWDGESKQREVFQTIGLSCRPTP